MTTRRHIKGTVYRKGPSWWFAFPLRDEDRERTGKDRYTARVPDRDDHLDVTKEYARKFKDSRVLAYERRQWSPIVDATTPTPGETPTLRVFGRAWLDAQSNANIVGDRGWFERSIAPTDLAAMRLDEIRPRHVKAFVEALKRTPAARGGTMAPRTIRNVYSVLHRILAAAAFEERITASPAMLPRGVLPKIVDKDPLARRTWIREWTDVEKLLTDSRVPPDRRVLYALEYMTGARFSEIAAARWLAWDPKRKPLGCLSIAYSRDLRTGRDKPVKSGVPREVPVHPRLAALLGAWHETGWEEHYGQAPTPEDRIVPTRSLTARDPRNNWTRHAEDCAELKIRRTRQHDARRTFISALRNAGARVDAVDWITHGREPTVQGQYTEPAWSVLCDAVRMLPVKAGTKRRK